MAIFVGLPRAPVHPSNQNRTTSFSRPLYRHNNFPHSQFSRPKQKENTKFKHSVHNQLYLYHQWKGEEGLHHLLHFSHELGVGVVLVGRRVLDWLRMLRKNVRLRFCKNKARLGSWTTAACHHQTDLIDDNCCSVVSETLNVMKSNINFNKQWLNKWIIHVSTKPN